MKDFKRKVAVITGAASGIGYGLAEHAANQGMKVVLADVEEDALVKAEKDIKETGAETLAVKTDVSKADDVKALAEKTLDAFGEVHLLFNNAGVSAGSTAWESTLADWKWVLGVDLWGVIHGVHFFVPIMIEQNFECRIVNVASVAGLSNNSGNDPYLVSKHGVVALSEALYRELTQRGYNIGVSVVCPGVIQTGIMESSRNRPVELRNPPNEETPDITDPRIREVRQAYRELIKTAMLPGQVADIVFQAIADNKFYVLPGVERFMPWVKTRMDDILLGRNPSKLDMPS